MTLIDQYALETEWSTRMTDDIIFEAIKEDIPFTMEMHIRHRIMEINRSSIDDEQLFIKFFSLILKDRASKPIQAIATQIGNMAGFKDTTEAFMWGIVLVKNCREAGLYTLTRVKDDWYVVPNFALDNETVQKLEKLQYLPPMQTVPKPWTDNHNGGWVWENKHLILGNKFKKHNKELAYDVINKLQEIPWAIDTDTFIYEKETNRSINTRKFLRVIDEYIDKPFHFVWRYDSRGRSYSSGYDLNLQTKEYGKALMSLHNKELITNIPNLYVAIANHAGKDKLTWKERIDWTAGQEVDDLATNEAIWEQPILGRKALRALKDSIDKKPSGYVMSLDATSSGLQIMAAISGCKKTSLLVNCIDSTKRYDVYGEVANLMNAQLSTPIPRKIAKECVMTHFYNSKATPKVLLSEKELAVFYTVIKGLLPGAEATMESINQCWDSSADYHTWTMPDGHVVYVPVVEPHSVTYSDELFDELPLRYNRQAPSDNFRSLCPNVIHSIDGYIAREMVRRCEFTLSHIHDCFVFSPDHMQEVTQMYRVIMAEIASGTLFRDIIRQLRNEPALEINKYSTDLDQDILKSSYMLC